MKKPNQIKEMEVKFNNFIPFDGFLCITFFGKMFIRNKNKQRWEDKEKKGQNRITKNHELTHAKQAIKRCNSWVMFYLLYVWQYLKNLPIINGFDMPYKFISIELEAFANENDDNYNIIHKDGTTGWKSYNKLTIKEKKQFYKQYKLSKKTFNTFILEIINPFLNI